MCLLALAIDPNPKYRLVMVANRDEFHARPTQPLHAWEHPAGIIAGRDELGGGTWMGVSSRGRLAALTNFREVNPPPTNAPSRGELVTGFLTSDVSPGDWVPGQTRQLADYAGFSLITGTLAQGFWCHSNRYNKVPLPAGVHALSNGTVNNDWPKVAGLRDDLAAAVASTNTLDEDALFALLQVCEPAPDDQLPDTGAGLELERLLSSRFIRSDAYGTRSATVLLVDSQGVMTVVERRYAPDGSPLGVTRQLVHTR